MKTIKSYLPLFTGFYNSIFEYDNEDSDIQYFIDEGLAPEGAKYDDFKFNYPEYHLRVSKAITNEVESRIKELGFDIRIDFEELTSPKEYNFASDTINCTYKLTPQVFEQIVSYLNSNEEVFKSYLKDKYTSCSGFISSYSNDAYTWLNEYLNDADKLTHCFGSILDFICQNEQLEENDIYYEVAQEFYVECEYVGSNELQE